MLREESSAAHTLGVWRDKEVAIAVLAIRAICRRFRIYRVPFAKSLPEDRLRPPRCYPEPEGESLHQSESIIGRKEGVGNESKGPRTTRVIYGSY